MFRTLAVVLLLCLWISGVQAQSLDTFERAVGQRPDDLTLLKQLAVSYYETGQVAEAVQQLEHIVKLAPGDGDAIRNLMAAYRMQSLRLQSEGQYSEALVFADKTISFAETHQLDAAPGRYQRIAILCEQGNTDAAQQELSQIPEGSSLLIDAQDRVVAALLREAKVAAQQEDYAETLTLIGEAARVAPQRYAYLHLQTVQILLGTGQSEKARTVLDPLARTLPLEEPFYAYRLGTLYHQAGDIDVAMTILQRVPETSSYYERAQELLGTETKLLALTRQAQENLASGDSVTASEHLRQALDVDPQQHRLRLNLAKIRLQQGKSQESLAELERLSTFTRVSQDAFYQFEMGQLYALLGETERSRNLLERIPETSIRYEEAQALLAKIQLPVPSEPVVAPEPTPVEQEPPVPDLQMVRTLMEAGQQAQALKMLQQILNQPDFRQDDRSRYEVGVLYLQLGDEAQGHEYLNAVSEESLFYQAAQAFLIRPPIEQPSPEPLPVLAPEESQEPSTPMHPVETRIRELASRHSIDLALAIALMKQESNFEPLAVSHVGAAGLCQIMPATGRDLGLKIPSYSDPKNPTVDPDRDERFHPYKAMDAGLRYLRQLLDRYDGNVPLALSAYNAGMGRTKERVARIYETTAYVSDIMTYYWRYQDTGVLQVDIDRFVQKLEVAGNGG